ncbi:hypothetical protein CCACVL1_19816 [Corchorus capsularis]|uniref:Uncharacterized protein n=1 Tax=Corchorus capsularis TaxID=210143 RepID=A0A1R3HEU8_COCAP|nr:hypothetical protein CCACVL1_19816 [Corchorus capsularis]
MEIPEAAPPANKGRDEPPLYFGDVSRLQVCNIVSQKQ